MRHGRAGDRPKVISRVRLRRGLRPAYAQITSISSSTVANATVPASVKFFQGGHMLATRFNLKFVGSVSDWEEQAVSPRRGYSLPQSPFVRPIVRTLRNEKPRTVRDRSIAGLS